MYFTSFHKAIFKEIWQRRSAVSKKDFDLEIYMDFYFKWHKRKYKEEIYQIDKADNKDIVFLGYSFFPEKRLLIKKKREREILLALKELDSILKHLNNNNLIYIIEKSQPKCIPLFCQEEKEAENSVKPFTEGLKIVSDYIGKNIQVREGFKKFKKFNYSSHEELVEIYFKVLIPLSAAILAAVLKILFGH